MKISTISQVGFKARTDIPQAVASAAKKVSSSVEKPEETSLYGFGKPLPKPMQDLLDDSIAGKIRLVEGFWGY